jgi:hypothetical protein
MASVGVRVEPTVRQVPKRDGIAHCLNGSLWGQPSFAEYAGCFPHLNELIGLSIEIAGWIVVSAEA